MEASSVLVLAKIHGEADFSIQFADLETIEVFQGEQSVHQAGIGVNVRHRESLRGDIQRFSQGRGQVCFGRPGAIFILSQPDISRLFWEADGHSEVFLGHSP